ncbi:hypothetical protein, partial [Candidatus Erwinia dacicola]
LLSEFALDIYHYLNKIFYDSCSKINNSWRIKEKSIDSKLVVLFLMKVISGKNNHEYAYIINEIWAECAREIMVNQTIILKGTN